MIVIIDCGSKKTPHISNMLKKLGTPNQILSYAELSLVGLPNHCNGIIISGAPILVTEIDPSPYLATFSFLKTTTIPVLGICFGHQILGMVYGANPSKCNEDRDWQTIDTITDSELFNGLSNTFKMKEDHCEQISVPAEFTLLASSSNCKNEAMQHKSKLLFGVQFHPEVSEEQGELLIGNFIHICIQ